MNKLVFTALLLVSAWSRAEDWVLLSSDGASRILLDAASIERNASNEVRFQVRRTLGAQRDMMGLGYNATQSRYVLACESGQILFRQQFLLQGEEVVWTFPESGKPQKAGDELPEAVLSTVCPANAAGSR